MGQALASDGLDVVSQELVLPAGYVVGTCVEVQRYVDEMISSLQSRPAAFCRVKGAEQAAHDVLVRRQQKNSGNGFKVHIHENRRGPVWNGQHVPENSVITDHENNVINEDGFKY